MANYSESTRKEQVLEALKARPGEWINGYGLANEKIGGSEGLKRLRELKKDGWLIQMRRNPAQGIDSFQYRIAVQLRADGRLAYHDPTLVDREEPDPAPVVAAPPKPAQSTWTEPPAVMPDTTWSDWKPAAKRHGVLEHVFWFERKQRVIGAIGTDGTRWLWGILLPGKKALDIADRRLANGVADSKNDAREAIEQKIREYRLSGIPRPSE